MREPPVDYVRGRLFLKQGTGSMADSVRYNSSMKYGTNTGEHLFQ